MADKRIIELEERLTLSDGDYFATDNTNGTCKVNAKILLDRFDDDEDDIATRAKKVDLTNISTTGSTNNSGATITSGTYFYKDGTLARAKTDIANGATLTLNTNYEIVTAGGLNSLNEALSNKQDKLWTQGWIDSNSSEVMFLVKVGGSQHISMIIPVSYLSSNQKYLQIGSGSAIAGVTALVIVTNVSAVLHTAYINGSDVTSTSTLNIYHR